MATETTPTTTPSSSGGAPMGLNNNGDNILATIFILLYLGIGLWEVLLKNVGIKWPLIGLVSVIISAVILYTNKEYPINNVKLYIAIALFVLPLVIFILAPGAAVAGQR